MVAIQILLKIKSKGVQSWKVQLNRNFSIFFYFSFVMDNHPFMVISICVTDFEVKRNDSQFMCDTINSHVELNILANLFIFYT